MQAATIQKAAWEGSPGTSRSNGRSVDARTVTCAGADIDVGVAQPQQLLGVLPGRHGLADGGLPLGRQAGEQHRPLDLGAGDRQPVVDPLQAAAPDGQRREAATLASIDAGAHLAQRLRHPVHGPAGDRGVTGQHASARRWPQAQPASSRIPVPELPTSTDPGRLAAAGRPPSTTTSGPEDAG